VLALAVSVGHAAECNDSLDNDGDLAIDLADSDCVSAADAFEGPVAVLGLQKISDTQGYLSDPGSPGTNPGGLLDDFDLFARAATLGDLDVDGRLEFWVGAAQDDDGGMNRGAGYVLFLNADGTVAARQKVSDTAGGLSGPGDPGGVLADQGRFGARAARLDDLDGDGVDDLAVGVWLDDGGGLDRGAVYVLRMNADGTVKAVTVIDDAALGGALDDSDQFGRGLAWLGTLGDPGLASVLAVGAIGDDDGGANRGALYLLSLAPDGSPRSQVKISDTNGFPGTLASFDGLGQSVERLGDLDDDGELEIAVGTELGGGNTGSVWILSLDASGTATSAVEIANSQAGFGTGLDVDDRFGANLASLGDLDGDGVEDLAASALRDDDGGTDRGALWLLFLNPDGSVQSRQKLSASSPILSTQLEDGDNFGAAAAADVDGNGVTDLLVGAQSDDDGGSARGGAYVLFLSGAVAVCGNAALDPIESCDDGNTTSGDGCFATCQVEDALRLFGTGAGGSVEVTIAGVLVSVTTSASDTPAAVAAALAAAINANASLQALGITAEAIGDAVYTSGTFGSGSSLDPGLVLSLDPGAPVGFQKISDTSGYLSDPVTPANPGGVLDNFDQFGVRIGIVPDFDGDGTTDLVVGADGDDDGGDARGAAYLLALNPDGTVSERRKISDTAGGLSGVGDPGGFLSNGDRFGGAPTSIGDLDGDGVGDLAVAAYENDGLGSARGAVYVLRMNADGTVKAVTKIADAPMFELDDGDRLGLALGWLGDIGGGTLPVLAVGATLDDDGGADRGAVYLLFLNRDGSLVGYEKISQTRGGFGGSLGNGDRLGQAVARLGDLDGDGTFEIAVGAVFGEGSTGPADTGSVWILSLNPDGTVADEHEIAMGQAGFTGTLAGDDWFGNALRSLGDIDGDGVADLAVGAQQDDTAGSNRGAIWLLFLNSDGTVKSHRKLAHDATLGFDPGGGNAFGISLAAGDVDGDGVTDLVAGSFDDDGGPDRGAVYTLFLDGAPAVCGNGVLDPLEECDDGGNLPGDRCSATCEWERPPILLWEAELTLELAFSNGNVASFDNLPPADPALVGLSASGTDLQCIGIPQVLSGTASATSVGVTTTLLQVTQGSGTFCRRGGRWAGFAPIHGQRQFLGLTTSTLPFQVASGGLGVGGELQMSGMSAGGGFTIASHDFNDWATTARTLMSGTNSTFTVQGFVHGPASLTSTATQTDGILQLVTPTRIAYTRMGLNTLHEPIVTRLTIRLVPEPRIFSMLAAGGLALALLGRRRGLHPRGSGR